jgi:hypothetical protein
VCCVLCVCVSYTFTARSHTAPHTAHCQLKSHTMAIRHPCTVH